MTYMLDTDTCIYLINNHPKIKPKAEPGDCVISVVVYAELERGNLRSSRPKANRVLLDRFLEGIEVLDLGQDTAPEYASIRVHLETKGKPIGPNDLWIAAHARSINATLVTNNVREFKRVPKLRVETWVR